MCSKKYTKLQLKVCEKNNKIANGWNIKFLLEKVVINVMNICLFQ